MGLETECGITVPLSSTQAAHNTRTASISGLRAARRGPCHRGCPIRSADSGREKQFLEAVSVVVAPRPARDG